MKRASIIFLCVCIALANATPQWVRMNSQEVLDDHAFSFKVALKPQNLEQLDSLFWQISNPESPFYGKFLSNEQIADLISLPDHDIKQVEEYLTSKSGQFCDVLIKRSIHHDYILVDTCAAQAGVILPSLKLSVYQKEGTNVQILRSSMMMDLSENLFLLGVPQELHQFIAGIHGVTDAPMHLSRVGANIDVSAPWLPTDKELTIPEMLTYFGVDNSGIKESTYTANNGQVRQSVVEFNNAAFSAQSLATFQKKYGIPGNPIKKIIGTQTTTEESLEASLDVQTITGIAQNVVTWDFVFDSTATFVDVVETIMATDDAPKVISCSWGGPESLMTKSAADAANNSLMKLGLSGFTFLAAAGDSGPALNPKNCNDYVAEFPGVSTYVLSVGGTAINKNTNVEGAWIHSSGGFSNYFPRPAFQNAAVEHYLENAPLPPNPNGRYTTTGRAYPDVSAIGALEPVFADGIYMPIGGTSGAAPQFAGIISLLNLHRFQNGLGPLGAVTPALYSLQKGVGHDVTEGQSYATSRAGCQGKYLTGYKAFAGWDPVTGLGSPQYPVLLEQLINLKSN